MQAAFFYCHFIRTRSNCRRLHLFKHENGVNIGKLDKGCIVFDSEKIQGFRVLLLIQTAQMTLNIGKKIF